jgi:LysM repeat protein
MRGNMLRAVLAIRPGSGDAPDSRRVLRLVVFAFVLFAACVWSQPAQAQDAVHLIAPGEHLSGIALRYGVTTDELMAYNGISNPDRVYYGQQLMIPGKGSATGGVYGSPADASRLPAAGGYYVVRRGDTLSQIAQANGVSIGDLMRINGIGNASFIWVGQRLRLTARVAAPGTTASQSARPEAASTIYVVQRGDTLSEIAQRFGISTQALLAANGLPNANFVWVGQRLRVSGAAAVSAETTGLGAEAAPSNGKRWIEINLTNQTLTAWQGDVAVMYTNISSGLAGTPTITGRFAIGAKYPTQLMSGTDFYLPNVPWVMYFYSGYAIHGAYWHNNFGRPMSHGCVNMRVSEAQMLYNWAAPGTEVYVHY